MMGSAHHGMVGMPDKVGFLVDKSGAPRLLPAMAVEEEEERKRARVWAAFRVASAVEQELEGDGVHGGGGQKRIKRLRVEQVRALEASFAEEAKLEPERKIELAEQLGLQPRQVAVWFQNRRARSKTKKLELDFATLSSHYHTLLAETHRLKAQVAQLTSELEHANKGANLVRDKEQSQCMSTAVLKNEEKSIASPSKKDVLSRDKMTTTFNPHARQFSPSCSTYSATLDSQNSYSMHKDKGASAYECNNMEDLEYSCLSCDWSEENPLATHQVLAALAYNTMQSQNYLVLQEQLVANNIHHVAMDWSLG